APSTSLGFVRRCHEIRLKARADRGVRREHPGGPLSLRRSTSDPVDARGGVSRDRGPRIYRTSRARGRARNADLRSAPRVASRWSPLATIPSVLVAQARPDWAYRKRRTSLLRDFDPHGHGEASAGHQHPNNLWPPLLEMRSLP